MEPSRSYNRYKGGTLVIDPEGDWIVPKRAGFDTSPRPDDFVHLVRQGERLDLLAWRYYDDARLYWVIALYNDIFWILDLKEGQELRMPSYATLQMVLLV